MRKHLRRGSYYVIPTTPYHTQQNDTKYQNSYRNGFMNDEAVTAFDTNGLPDPPNNYNLLTVADFANPNRINSISRSQELIFDSSKSPKVNATRINNRHSTERYAKYKRYQKLHRSCNDLNNEEYDDDDDDDVPSISEFHHNNNWRDINGIHEMTPQYSQDRIDRIKSVGKDYCDIGNCGKVLWISRNRNRNNYQEVPSNIGLPNPWDQSTVHKKPAFIVRTNAQGLPYTPSPHQRRAYLANQHAIKAAIPLVVNDGSYIRRKKSPNRYIESDVNIHYKTPIRYEYKEPIAEEELAMRQAEQMQKLYQEERRRKYLQELQDMNSRRHADNFTPSQKSPIPLNRYEDFQADLAPKISSPAMSPRTVARALYSFQGQTARELTFRKGDVIYIRRKIDKNWYEGEHNAMIGLLPASYVEIISKDGIRQPLRKAAEGQARAKYNFQAQSGIELSLNKGELVTLTRRVDDNWFEGKIANRKGIFPVSYVEVLSDIGSKDYSTPRTVTNQRPSLEALRASINDELNAITQNGHHTPNGILRETRNTPTTDMLHVDTSSNPLTFRALYKYRPQNSDELELQEGDIIHVLEKCDDGWFVGTSQRTGYFGTFPGNYVERV